MTTSVCRRDLLNTAAVATTVAGSGGLAATGSAAAQDGGAQVSRDDWVFPNWDPTQDYREAQYKELGG